MTPSLISCVVPVFNGEVFLGEALDSILAQTYRPLEVIVVDDGSTDGTAEVAAGYGKQITYLRQPDVGLAAARNCGLETAHGEFIAFLDADDIWHREKLARQMARFREKPEIDMCTTHFQNFWTSGLGEEEKRYQEHRLARPMAGWIVATLLARRSVFEKVGQFDPSARQGGAPLWFLHAVEVGSVLELLPDVLVYRRFHGENFTRRASTACMNNFLHFIKAWKDYQRQRTVATGSKSELSKPAMKQDGRLNRG